MIIYPILTSNSLLKNLTLEHFWGGKLTVWGNPLQLSVFPIRAQYLYQIPSYLPLSFVRVEHYFEFSISGKGSPVQCLMLSFPRLQRRVLGLSQHQRDLRVSDSHWSYHQRRHTGRTSSPWYWDWRDCVSVPQQYQLHLLSQHQTKLYFWFCSNCLTQQVISQPGPSYLLLKPITNI